MKIEIKGLTEDGRMVWGGFSVHATGKIIQDMDEIAFCGKVIEILEVRKICDKCKNENCKSDNYLDCIDGEKKVLLTKNLW